MISWLCLYASVPRGVRFWGLREPNWAMKSSPITDPAFKPLPRRDALGPRGVKPLIVIEHCEDHLSRWVLYEYEDVVRLAGRERVVFTNVSRSEWCEKLSRLARCYRESVAELRGVLWSSPERVIILDPSADKLLEPRDTRDAEVVVVGGILGDHPPRGRTRRCITERISGARARSLGPHQLSIDGAVYVYLRVEDGLTPSQVPLVVNPKLQLETLPGIEVEVELPFAYPLVDGKPLIPEGVLRLLKSGLPYYEAMRM
ncbi:protein of unknown function DUF431 [Pyrolobus fumarii 1A]|uniref:SAM-dependent RNA methyltransferase n=1 Tax=Pyrolobus fumarii (strain DSM 11204 / 1A) TaxID=694429 RepID=G0ED95_PYRF1|nr:SAM-dependent methyltransferase [Pyrolobus fumarii]AEM39773.1 protein of unknown function DUF431 [Pyrolobus fumarii 1A]